MEIYLSEPLDVEVFPLGASTDIILRKNIKEIATEDGTAWECEEIQQRIAGEMSAEDARNNFDALWNDMAQEDSSIETRISDLEEALDMILSGVTE